MIRSPVPEALGRRTTRREAKGEEAVWEKGMLRRPQTALIPSSRESDQGGQTSDGKRTKGPRFNQRTF
jgi:hypothetical protein